MRPAAKIPATVDEYLERIADDDKRSLLVRIRKIIRQTAPGAEESISYQMPSYKLNGILVYFAAFAHHCSLFPASTTVLDEFREELASFKTSKGTIQFTVDHPLPEALVRKIIKARLRENEARAAAKRSKPRK